MIVEALLIGAFVGIVVGSLGAGGGILSVPILVYILGQDPHQATGLSLIIVGLTAAVSLATRARGGNVAWREGTLFALAGLVGTWAGSTLGPLVSARALMLSFCALLAAVAVFMVRSQLRPSASLSPNEAGAPLFLCLSQDALLGEGPPGIGCLPHARGGADGVTAGAVARGVRQRG